MKDAMKLLEAIGEIQDRYILDARQPLPESSHKKLGLIAIFAAVLLILAGCAAMAWHWYADYFTQQHRQPLSQSQIDYIQDNAQDYQVRQTCDGYTLELKSTISEAQTAYVTFGLTAPEDVDLSAALDLQSEERISFHKLLAFPEGSDLPANLSYSIHDDGDGKAHTLNIVLRIDPVIQQGVEDTFHPGKSCKIQFQDIVKWGYDREYARKLSEKYGSQTDYMLSPEESERLHPQTTLVSGNWTFEISWPQSDVQSLELLTAPLSAKVLVCWERPSEPVSPDTVEPVTLTSIQLTPLSMTISFEPPEPRQEFVGLFIDATQFQPTDGMESIFLMMQDGSKITFFQSDSAKDIAYLTADSPIVLSQVAYLQLSDGTKVFPPA